MQPPAFLLPRPRFAPSAETERAFENLWASTPGGGYIDYRLTVPKWQFLTYLCAAHDVVLHGSCRRDIATVEPRQANDVRAFSNQRAIYATTDGIWVIFFAIVDRHGHPEASLFNTCLQARIAEDAWSDPACFFSITHAVLLRRPWCEGVVYLLPCGGFRQEAPQRVRGTEVVFPHWIGSEAVEPLARLPVGPRDFPFLDEVHGHDDEMLVRLAAADPGGFPGPEGRRKAPTNARSASGNRGRSASAGGVWAQATRPRAAARATRARTGFTGPDRSRGADRA